jgi:hypothetical protein
MRTPSKLLPLALLAACATPRGSVTPPPDAAPLPVPDDASLEAVAYVDLGVPAPDRLWSGEDYQRAAKALAALEDRDPAQLPRYASPRSGAVFARMTDGGNFAIATDGALPPAEQLGLLGGYLTPLNDLLRLYLRRAMGGQGYGAELASLMTLMLRGSALSARAAGALEPSDDPARRAQFFKGLDQMRQGFANVVSGFLQSMAERRLYAVAERRRMAQALDEDLPGLASFLPPLSRQELPKLLRRLADGEPDAAVRARIEAIREKLDAG